MQKKTLTKKVTTKNRVKKLKVNTDVYDLKNHNTLMRRVIRNYVILIKDIWSSIQKPTLNFQII